MEAVEIVEFESGWSSHRAAWSKLYARSPRAPIFYHPAFLSACAGLAAASRPTHLALLFDHQQELLSGVPLTLFRRAGTRVARLFSIAHEGFDHLSPLDTSGTWQHALHLLSALGRKGWIRAFVGDGVLEEFSRALVAAHPATFSRETFGCPLLALPRSEEALLFSLAKKFRWTLRTAQREAQKGGVEVRVIGESSSTTEKLRALSTLRALHQARCQATGRRSRFLTPPSERFHAALVEQTAPTAPLLWVELTREKRVIASIYGFSDRARFWFYQSGFDIAEDNSSLGALAIFETVKYLIGTAHRELDFLRGRDRYKDKWTKVSVRDTRLLCPLSLSGRLAVSTLRLSEARRRHGRLRGFLAWGRGGE